MNWSTNLQYNKFKLYFNLLSDYIYSKSRSVIKRLKYLNFFVVNFLKGRLNESIKMLFI